MSARPALKVPVRPGFPSPLPPQAPDPTQQPSLSHIRPDEPRAATLITSHLPERRAHRGSMDPSAHKSIRPAGRSQLQAGPRPHPEGPGFEPAAARLLERHADRTDSVVPTEFTPARLWCQGAFLRPGLPGAPSEVRRVPATLRLHHGPCWSHASGAGPFPLLPLPENPGRGRCLITVWLHGLLSGLRGAGTAGDSPQARRWERAQASPASAAPTVLHSPVPPASTGSLSPRSGGVRARTVLER